MQQLKIEYQQQNGTLTLPGTSGQPGGAQQLFYADAAQKNQAWINQGLADPAIIGLIVKTPIKPQTNPDALDLSRDRLTGLPLDDQGRYTVRVDVGNPIDGYETYTPKYFPCATAECVRSGQNLDMSDPETRAYVMALDKKILDDIGKASTVVVVANPLGASGAVASAVGPLTSLASGMLEDRELRALFKEGLQAAAQAYIHRVYGLPQQVAARLVGVVDLAGGWQAFVDRSTSNINQR